MKKFILLFYVLASSYSSAQDLTGSWLGDIEAPGLKLPVIFHIESLGSTLMTSMDSPQQGAFGIRADSTSLEEDRLQIKFTRIGVVYKGQYDPSNEVITGTFSQGGMNIPLDLTREKTDQEVQELIRRPQEPKEPFAYRSEDISFHNEKDDIRLAGTLTLPQGTGKFPAVVLISGSGPQNRDSEAFGHRPFLVLSDHLTNNGIAVLRFDERGVGQSSGDFSAATSKDLANDVASAVDFLATQAQIDTDRIGLIGHSEGGIVAPMVASGSEEVDYMILLAGPVLPGDQNLLLQKKRIEEKMGVDPQTIRRGQQIFKEAYDLVKHPDTSGLHQRLMTHFQEAFSTGLTTEQVEALTDQLTAPWMIFYLNHDPLKTLRITTIPVLALFAENDLQVPAQENAEILLTEDLDNHWTIEVMDNLNHLFQESSTGLPHEYSQIDQTISPVVLETITTWIHQQAGPH